MATAAGSSEVAGRTTCCGHLVLSYLVPLGIVWCCLMLFGQFISVVFEFCLFGVVRCCVFNRLLLFLVGVLFLNKCLNFVVAV